MGLSVVSRKKGLQLRGEKAFLFLITDNSVNSLLAVKLMWKGRIDLGSSFRSPRGRKLAAGKG